MSTGSASHGGRMRDALGGGGVLPFVGVYDVFSASLAARRFPALFVSGFGFAASHYGLPDVGFIAWSDMVSFVERLRSVLPSHHLLVDVDDGYGDAEVAAHVVTRMTAAGASGVVLEDQARPRRCGHVDGKRILPLGEYLEKLARVLVVRGDTFVVARTDAAEPREALERVEAFARAGADAVLVDGVKDLELVRAVRERAGVPVAFNQIAGGKSPACDLARLEEAGVALVVYSTPLLFAAQTAVAEAAALLEESGGALERLPGVRLAECQGLLEENLRARDGAPLGAAPEERPFDAAAPIAPRAPGAPAPLSFAQQRLWFLDQLEPGLPVYNVPKVLRLRGSLDVRALEAALTTVVSRHETLRSVFGSRMGEPFLSLLPPSAVAVPLVDLRRLAEPLRAAEAERLAAEEVERPFDLSTGPLLRARLLRLSDEEHLFVLTIHHIVSDGWSVGVLFRELEEAYRAALEGRAPDLPALAIQYADFAAWQRAALIGPALEEPLAYWRERLAGAPPLLALPFDRPRPPAQSFRGARHSFRVEADLLETLRALGRSEGATLFMTLLAAFQTLLARTAGQDDVAVGTPIAGRGRVETEPLVGFFVNTLVLRTDLSGDPTFREALRRVREVALGAYAHEDLPFEKLVEALSPERNLAHSPLFQVLFSLQNQPGRPLALPGLAVEPVTVPRSTARFELALDLVERDGGLEGILSYGTDLFDASTIVRTAERFVTLLAGAASNPDRPLSRLPLLPAAERALVVNGWNATERPLPWERTVPARFEAQAAATPLAVAAEMAGRRLTYEELDRRANQVARHLLRRLEGAPAGEQPVVGVCVERSLEMLVALMGVMKAGAAYLPLDPSHPRSRLLHALADARAPVVLTEAAHLEIVPRGAVPVLLDDARLFAGESAERPRVDVSPSALAYLIHTSGSTGVPKGVMVEHLSVVNLLEAMRREIGATSSDTLLAVTTISFDIAALELFLPLVSGGRVVLMSRETAADPALLAARLAEGDVTLMQATPATWRLLVEEGWRGSPRLTALCGGEALPVPLARALHERCGRVFNVYGPTETTIWSTLWPVDPSRGLVPIGRPLDNTTLYVLDASGAPAPIGVAGELFIGGTGVARGYWRRPDLTRERFIPDPFRAAPGARMYRTGDRVRWLSDGTVEFLGRLDGQVKVRGFRVETGEVEQALQKHPLVASAAVVAREERLVAFLVPRAEPAPSARELRTFLSETLPEYMLPSAFVPLRELPLSTSGKVDRAALPASEEGAAGGDEGFVAPRTPDEEVLAGIWSQVLRRPHVGVHDNFFDLGGHSLLATQIVSRVRDSFRVPLPLRELFERPTIAQLSEAVESLRTRGAEGEGGRSSRT